jgi:hypothetical protein
LQPEDAVRRWATLQVVSLGVKVAAFLVLIVVVTKLLGGF